MPQRIVNLLQDMLFREKSCQCTNTRLRVHGSIDSVLELKEMFSNGFR